MLGVYQDITERERARQELVAVKELFRTAFMTGPDVFYIATLEEGRVLEVNEEFLALFGYPRAEVIGKTSLELGLYDDPTERSRIVSALRATGLRPEPRGLGKEEGRGPDPGLPLDPGHGPERHVAHPRRHPRHHRS